MSVDLSKKVSWVSSARETATTDVTIAWIVEQIRIGGFKEKVVPIRSAVALGDARHAKSWKLGLPAIMWSGLFSRRSAAGLVQHSGLIVADLDNLGPNLQTVRERLIPSPHLLLLFVSPSGTGLKAVFRVSPDPALHVECFNAVARHVSELTGAEIDPSGKDVSRLCFISYDPAIFVNSNDPLPLTPGPLFASSAPQSANVTPTLLTPRRSSRYEKSINFSWVASLIPTEIHQTNHTFFTIARHLLAEEEALGRRYTAFEMKGLFDYWHARCPPEFLSGSKEEYFYEFCRICAYAKTPIGESNLDKAWKRALVDPYPPEASLVSDKLKPLVALCVILQESAGTEPFFLSCRQVANLLGVEPMTAQRWLKQLVGSRIIICVKKGTVASHQASEYRYMDSTPIGQQCTANQKPT